ncbi:MAG: hypothetical protein H6835_09405 [Planctomycetes bacterium]|nr:hypothetical protein [Planctomycetota bacterium]
MPHLARRTLVGSVLVATAGLLLSAGFVRSRAESAWQHLGERADSLHRRWATQQRPRAPLWGEPGEGRALDRYVAGGKLAMALDCMQQGEVGRLLRLTDPELAASPLRAGWQAPLAALDAGAHATDTSPLRGPSGEEDIANMLELRALANLAQLEAGARRAEGDGTGAVRVTLDAMTMGADLVRDGLLINQMIGCAMLQIPMEHWSDDALRGLDDAARQEFARGLQRLDESLPCVLRFDREAIYVAGLLQRMPADAEDCWPAAPGLRYGFSSRWMLADAFLMFADMADELRALETAPWSEREHAWQRHVDRMLASGNAAAGTMCPNLIAAETNLRQSLTRVRLLRTALAMHIDPQTPACDDPFGDGPLQLERAPDGVLVRSVYDHVDLSRRVTE